ncbi:MAG TPA: hypothetical protein VHT97_15020 [Acidimicrobiales bacterium]|nr:hypothetical protein [Acidimicrobiales bacterium]
MTAGPLEVPAGLAAEGLAPAEWAPNAARRLVGRVVVRSGPCPTGW